VPGEEAVSGDRDVTPPAGPDDGLALTPRPSAGRERLLLVAAVVALLLLVSAAAGAARSGAVVASRGAGFGVPAWVFEVVLAFVASAAMLVTVGLSRLVLTTRWRRRRHRWYVARPEELSWWQRVLATALAVALALGFVAILVVLVRLGGSPAHRAHPAGVSPHLPPSAGTPSQQGIGWLGPAIGAGAALAAAAAVALVARLRRRGPPRPWQVRRTEPPRSQAVAALDDSLAALQAEPDPRRAIIAAYARMDRSMAHAGLGRQAWEAPFEHLGRVFEDLGATAAVAGALAELFERAKFGHHPCGNDMKHAAVAALVQLRDDLGRLSQPRPEGV
jgi:hypothetical protein